MFSVAQRDNEDQAQAIADHLDENGVVAYVWLPIPSPIPGDCTGPCEVLVAWEQEDAAKEIVQNLLDNLIEEAEMVQAGRRSAQDLEAGANKYGLMEKIDEAMSARRGA